MEGLAGELLDGDGARRWSGRFGQGDPEKAILQRGGDGFRRVTVRQLDGAAQALGAVGSRCLSGLIEGHLECPPLGFDVELFPSGAWNLENRHIAGGVFVQIQRQAMGLGALGVSGEGEEFLQEAFTGPCPSEGGGEEGGGEEFHNEEKGLVFGYFSMQVPGQSTFVFVKFLIWNYLRLNAWMLNGLKKCHSGLFIG